MAQHGALDERAVLLVVADDAHAAPQDIDELQQFSSRPRRHAGVIHQDTLNALNTRIQGECTMATSIRFDPAIEQRLDKLAAQTGRTKAYYLRELVANGLWMTWRTTSWRPRRWNASAREKSAFTRWRKWSAILAWRIELTATAVRQIGKLDKNEAKRITTFLRQRLATLDDPRSTGKGNAEQLLRQAQAAS